MSRYSPSKAFAYLLFVGLMMFPQYASAQISKLVGVEELVKNWPTLEQIVKTMPPPAVAASAAAVPAVAAGEWGLGTWLASAGTVILETAALPLLALTIKGDNSGQVAEQERLDEERRKLEEKHQEWVTQLTALLVIRITSAIIDYYTAKKDSASASATQGSWVMTAKQEAAIAAMTKQAIKPMQMIEEQFRVKPGEASECAINYPRMLLCDNPALNRYYWHGFGWINKENKVEQRHVAELVVDWLKQILVTGKGPTSYIDAQPRIAFDEDAKDGPCQRDKTNLDPKHRCGRHFNVSDKVKTIYNESRKEREYLYYGSIVCCPCCMRVNQGITTLVRCGFIVKNTPDKPRGYSNIVENWLLNNPPLSGPGLLLQPN